MKVVIQRSKNASVKVEEKIIGKIDKGMVILVCFKEGDTLDNIDKMIKKIVNLRIFDDENKVMNKSILEVSGSILSISQFTLYADTKKGNRPSYHDALDYDQAKVFYEEFNERLSKFIHVETSIFGSDMQVSLINDGPITIIMEN